MRSFVLIALTASAVVACCSAASAQGYYTRTAVRNSVTGRQQIVDNRAPRYGGAGQGGLMFDGPSGSLQMTAVRRNRFTGRLEYYNEYVNPWTGARYSTATQFNPFTGRYQTQHNFAPPPEVEEDLVVEVQRSLPKRGIRVIESQEAPAETPPEVNPPWETLGDKADNEEPAVTIEIRSPEEP